MYFERHSLREAGLLVQLGHDGNSCSRPHEPVVLTILDLTGIHLVRVQFCDCGVVGSSKHFVQMLRTGWWPASIRRPRTGFTIRLLEFFHALTLESNGTRFSAMTILTVNKNRGRSTFSGTGGASSSTREIRSASICVYILSRRFLAASTLLSLTQD